jgi:hypothetical protein
MGRGATIPTVGTMTSTFARAGVVERTDRGSFLAWLCLTGAVLTVGGSLVIVLLTPASSDTLFRYPFTPRGFVAAQILFVVNHLLLLAGVLALARARAAQGRAWTAGITVTVVGLLAWTACELWAITLVHRLTADPPATAVITGYGIGNAVLGIGLIITGVAVVRARRWAGWARWIPLILGIGMFVVVVPGTLAGFLAGRIALAVWMLGWAALGVALVRGTATQQ